MVTFVEGPVRVQVPATTANLGPGFDSLGLALGLHDELAAEIVADGLEVEVTGEGAGSVSTDETHLVVRSMRAAFEALGGQPAGLRLTCRNLIPHGRGLGSSSAAIVGGLFLARALVAEGAGRLDDDALFQLAAALEGHPDNVAPAVYGGLVISGSEGGEWFAVSAPVAPEISADVFVPPDPLLTETARGLLPTAVPHAQAAANAGRAALLVAALASSPVSNQHLLLATRDYLHQSYRRQAMAASIDLVERLRSAGAAAVVSGAGPSVLVLHDPQTSGVDLGHSCPPGWTHHSLRIARQGARVSATR